MNIYLPLKWLTAHLVCLSVFSSGGFLPLPACLTEGSLACQTPLWPLHPSNPPAMISQRALVRCGSHFQKKKSFKEKNRSIALSLNYFYLSAFSFFIFWRTIKQIKSRQYNKWIDSGHYQSKTAEHAETYDFQDISILN